MINKLRAKVLLSMIVSSAPVAHTVALPSPTECAVVAGSLVSALALAGVYRIGMPAPQDFKGLTVKERQDEFKNWVVASLVNSDSKKWSGLIKSGSPREFIDQRIQKGESSGVLTKGIRNQEAFETFHKIAGLTPQIISEDLSEFSTEALTLSFKKSESPNVDRKKFTFTLADSNSQQALKISARIYGNRADYIFISDVQVTSK